MKKPRDMRQVISSPPARQPESHMTHPLSDIEKTHDNNSVSVPPLSDVVEAREWVNHNQK